MEHEATIRLSVFLGLFALLALAERLFPRRAAHGKRPKRWFTNISITVIDAVTLRLVALVLPLLAIGAAWDAQSMGWGLFNALGWRCITRMWILM